MEQLMITKRSRGQALHVKGRMAKQLLIHNISINGLRATIYCYGLSASRYIEYAGALTYLLPVINQEEMVLEVGCGHSILPTFWQKLRVRTIGVDTNRDALKWQSEKSKKTPDAIVAPVLADMRCLPFKGGIIKGVSCISVIEHVPDDGDVKAASEIGRVLKSDGICVISFPLSANRRSYVKYQWTTGIPSLVQTLLYPCLQTILRKFKVDRTTSYFERFFSLGDVGTRIVAPSKCMKQDYFVLKSNRLTKSIYQKIIPTGFLTLLEYWMARFLTMSRLTGSADAIVIELKKGES